MSDIDRLEEQLRSVCQTLTSHHDRIAALESRPCNCSAAKAKPHAETAEEVAWSTARDVLDTVFNCNGQGYGNMLDKLTPIITAAIRRERGEA